MSASSLLPRGSPHITRSAGPTYPGAADRTTFVVGLTLRDQQVKCKGFHAEWLPSHEQGGPPMR
jgi:hypothetical protein